MSAEENKALMRRLFDEVWNEGNLDLADELVAPDYVDHDPTMPEEVRGPEGFKQFVSSYRTAFSDGRVVVEDQVAEGDMVATRWRAMGTHDGDFFGIAAPTGRRVEFTGIEISRISGGKLAETWDSYDALGMMTQLGLVPVPEEAQG